MVLGYTRLLRRTIRRESNADYGKAYIGHYKHRLAELLERVDTLVFLSKRQQKAEMTHGITKKAPTKQRAGAAVL